MTDSHIVDDVQVDEKPFTLYLNYIQSSSILSYLAPEIGPNVLKIEVSIHPVKCELKRFWFRINQFWTESFPVNYSNTIIHYYMKCNKIESLYYYYIVTI